MKILTSILLALLIMPATGHDTNEIKFKPKFIGFHIHAKRIAWEVVPIIRDRGYVCNTVSEMKRSFFNKEWRLICDERRYKYLAVKIDGIWSITTY